MSTSQATANNTYIADGALAIFTYAKFSGDRLVDQAVDGAAPVTGIVMETVADGESVPVMTKHGGEGQITLGATLSAGDLVMPGAGGAAVALAGVDAFSAGELVEGGVAGDIVAVLFHTMRGVSA